MSDLYPKSVKEWLEKWDSGESVWSVEMGGLGPEYEQCIHITAAELMRSLVDTCKDPKDYQDEIKRNAIWDIVKDSENVASTV